MMKLHSSSLLTSIAIWFCSSAFEFVGAKTLLGDAELQLLVGLETRLDHSEMNRIFSNPNHHHLLRLKADKVALARKAKAHIGACLKLYHSSIDDHNKSNKVGGGLELIPLAKDGSRFYLAGNVKDFTLYLKKGGGGDDGGDDGGFFISFDEDNSNKKNQVTTITAKYEDGQSAKKFSQELTECTGFIGSFHRRSSRNNINGSSEANKDSFDSNKRMLNPRPSNDDSSLTCPFYTPIGAKLNRDYYMEHPSLVGGYENIQPATPDVIRAIYGVPPIDNTCERAQYKPRDSLVFELGQVVGTDDLACYNDFFDLQDTTVTSIDVGAGDFSDILPQGNSAPNGICELPDCVCSAEVCSEANLDVQMIAAMSAGTDIKALNYASDSDYESDVLVEITKLIEDDDAPSVVSISYGVCNTADQENTMQIIEICKSFGLATLHKGITFFVSSGDAGATDDERNGICGTYCDQTLANCPYVTAVGGTFGSKAGEEQLSTNSDQGLNIASGGGFSKVFTTANGFDLSFQTAAVESWRNQHDASMSLPGYTLPDGSVGRGFPDVSAKSDNIVVLIGGQLSVISGTSASAPIFAGIVNLCASQLPEDQTGFGWINPLLYKNQDIFFDIIGGDNSRNAASRECPDPIPPVIETCPAGDTIAKAYLTYDGSLGETVFVGIQTTGTTFVSSLVKKDDAISFGFDVTNKKSDFDFAFKNLKEVSIIVSNSDPDQGGVTIITETLSTSCPGPWTIGSTIASGSGLVLNGFLNYDNEFDSQSVNIKADKKFFGFKATSGWDPASGIGTIGTTDHNDPNKGFRGLCKVLLGKPFDFEKIKCTIPTAAPTKKNRKQSKKKRKNK